MAPTSPICAIPIRMDDVTDAFAGSGFKIFAGQIASDANVRVWAIPAPTGGNRAFCDRMNSWAQGEGQPGLGYIFFRDGGQGAGPIANNLGPERTAVDPRANSRLATAMRCSSSAACRACSRHSPARRGSASGAS